MKNYFKHNIMKSCVYEKRLLLYKYNITSNWAEIKKIFVISVRERKREERERKKERETFKAFKMFKVFIIKTRSYREREK